MPPEEGSHRLREETLQRNQPESEATQMQNGFSRVMVCWYQACWAEEERLQGDGLG